MIMENGIVIDGVVYEAIENDCLRVPCYICDLIKLCGAITNKQCIANHIIAEAKKKAKSAKHTIQIWNQLLLQKEGGLNK